MNFRERLFFYFTAVFIVFTALILVFQYEREKEFKKEVLDRKLNIITEIIQRYISNNSIFETENYKSLNSVKAIIPDSNIRITVIDRKGVVLYDSEVEAFEKMENHLHRSEIQQSMTSEFGIKIRKSATTGNSYYYYSKFYENYFVRTATFYDIKIKKFLKAENLFLIYIITLFAVLLIILLLLTKNFSNSITKLRDFTIKLSTDKKYDREIVFPNDELGTIGKQIIVLYDKLNIAKNKTTLANDKLFAHLQALNEGVAFFSQEKQYLLSNKNFIQYLNIIANKSTISSENFFKLKPIEKLTNFIDEKLSENLEIVPKSLPFFEIDIDKDGKYFNVWTTIFPDKSFEVVIKNTTKLKKQKIIKQQITSNIAHELRTPVTTILGYLETIKRNVITEKKQKYFLSKTYSQANRLSELIEDLSVLNKIEESGELFKFEKIDLIKSVNDVIENLRIRLEQQNIAVEVQLGDELTLWVNKSLIFSVFFNLFDNAVKYGGKNISICLKKYHEDKSFFYFSFANTGVNIDQKHFFRIFERFYRVESGRSRKTGGTGLGLAIVKNAIELHGGEISAGNNGKSGVEFLFTLTKHKKKTHIL